MAWQVWALAALAGMLVLAAAKAHGRQLRLEREAHGHLEVDFRRDNHPWVEALWRRDRRGFWPTFAALAALGIGLTWVGAPALGPAAFALAVAWAFAAAFVAMGLGSLLRLTGSGAGAPAWRAAALRGSAAWWGLVAVLALANAVLAAQLH